MKYILRILLALVLAVAAIVGVYYYFNGKLPQALEHSTTEYHTTVTKQPASELYAKRTQLARLKKQNITLYKSGKTIILRHNKKEFPFEHWTSMLTAEEAPKIYYNDFDGDGVNEIVIRAEAGMEDSTKEKIYDLYVLNPTDKKESAYDVLLISQDAWRQVLDEVIVEELTQLKTNKKFLQFAMAAKRTDIVYNPDNGMVVGAPSLAFARALQGETGSYLTVNSWTLTKGFFSVDGKDINADVEVLVYYDGVNLNQKLGKVHFGLDITKENTFTIAKKSMYFQPAKEYRIANPKQQAQGNWEFRRNNSAAVKEPKSIRWIKYETKLDPSMLEDTVDFGMQETDMKYIRSMVLHKNNLVLTAAGGCTFTADAVKKGDYSVTINKGGKNEYEISYTASLNDNATVLTVTFDKAYARNEINSIHISYGSK